jgi:hypothetical protein
VSADDRTIRLKEERGWFAAGESFRRALCQLSDGAFKLFAWLCLEATRTSRHSGQVHATQKELAKALGKSKRAIGRWVAELGAKGLCHVEMATNQHQRTRFQISDSYWPYHRPATTRASVPLNNGNDSPKDPKDPKEPKDEDYVATVRDWFIGLDCSKGSFSGSDAEFAAELQKRGVPLQTVESALLLGASRKYESWLNGRPSSPIGSLRYFEDLIEEVTQLPFGDDYRSYLRGKVRQFAAATVPKPIPRAASPKSSTPRRPV